MSITTETEASLSLAKINTSLYHRKKETTYENMLFFIVIASIILVFGGFWSMESILWNRIIYGTGSLWKNNAPKYHSDQGFDLPEVLNLIHINFGIFLVGIIVLAGISFMVFYKTIVKKEWNNKWKMLSITGSFFSSFIALFGFWLFQSINVIETLNLDLSDDLLQTGFDWIRTDLTGFAELLENVSIAAMGFFFIALGLYLYVIIKNWPKPEKKRSKKKVGNSILKTLKSLPFYLVLIGYLIFSLFPVYVVLKVSVSDYTEILTGANPGSALYNFILNYSSVLFSISTDEPSFSSAIANSLFVGFGTGLIGLIVSVTAAYALARFKFRGNKSFTFLILTTQMFPGIIILLPQYVIWAYLGYTDSIGGLLLASAVGSVAYVTWMMKGYFETIPIDIEEAAIIDGSTRVGNFTKIAFPLARSGLVAVLIFTFLSAWQDFILARTLLRTPEKYTLALLADNYQNAQDQAIFFELLAPYSILVALPPVLFFIFMQKDLAKGTVAGSIK